MKNNKQSNCNSNCDDVSSAATNNLQFENMALKQIVFKLLNTDFESEEQLSLLRNSEVIPYISFDTKCSIIEVNSAWLRMSGYEKDEVINKPIQNFQSDFSRQNFQSCFSLLQQNKVISNVIEECKHKNGSMFHVLKSGVIHHDEHKNEHIAHCIYLDISYNISCQKNYIESLKEWEIIFDTISTPIIILDPEQTVVHANKAVLDKSELLAEKIIGKKCHSVFHKSLADRPLNCPCKKMFQTLQNETHEMYVEMLDGIYLVSCTPLFDNDGKLKNIIHVATDITEKTKYEKQILLSEQRFKNVVLNTPVVSFVIDKNGIFTLSEGLGLTKLELQPGEVVGLSAFDVYKDYPQIVASIKRGLKGENVHENLIINDIHFDIMYTPVKDTSGKGYQIIGLAIDNTESVKAQQELEEQEKKFRMLFSQMDQGVAIFEEIKNPKNKKNDYKYIDINDAYANIFGLERKDFINESITSIVHENFQPGMFKRIEDVMKTGQSILYEEYFKDIDVFVDIIMYRSQYNQFVVIMRDITDKKKNDALLQEKSEELEAQNEEYLQLNEELLQANQELYEAKEKAVESDMLKSSFLANLSHEIRTPMNAILGFSDLLHDAETYEDKEHYISIIQKSGEHLMSIINDIVDVSKIETGQVQPYYELIYVKPFILEIYRTMKVTIPDNKYIELEIAYAKLTDDSTLYIDQVKLRQILINLISNAIKFTQSGKITFAASMKNNNKEIEFVVSDTGIGVDKKDHTAIFDRFRQVESDSNIKSKGSGLGLAISKAYVEMMGGEISVSSKINKGSRFTVLLPCIDKPTNIPAVSKHKIKQENARNFGENETIIIAEDDDVNYFYLSRLFANTHFTIIRSHHGQEAVELVDKHPDVKLVLMDIKMPVMNGYEAARRIQKKYPNISIVAQTAYALVEDEKRIKDAGFQGYIRKPIKRDSLFEVLHSIYSK
ncbi:MAG: PAS domain S-box protein [Bacteroidales bacterium]|jgi:PAS domain S-box-containing protein|nr:PAS domain S-box protein [Bacteroidales bacterium]